MKNNSENNKKLRGPEEVTVARYGHLKLVVESIYGRFCQSSKKLQENVLMQKLVPYDVLNNILKVGRNGSRGK